MQVGLIVACDPSGIIGIDNEIPWKYPSDLKRFKALTMGGTLIMGRRTFESLGRRHLPGRTTFVLSSAQLCDAPTFHTLPDALANARLLGPPIWVIGGARVYRDALERGLIDFVDITLVPPVQLPEGDHQIASFPMGLLSGMTLTGSVSEPPLEHRRYVSHPER